MRRAAFFAALALAAGGARAQYILGEEAWLVGSDSGFDRPPATGNVAPAPVFELVAGTATPNDLPDSLVVNSTTMTLVLACDAQGISGTNWTCRDSSGNVVLAETGAGASPTTTINTMFHAADASERGVSYASAGKTHSASASNVGDLGTDDLVVEWVGRLGSANASLVDKGIAGADGWAISGGFTTAPRLSLRTASTTAAIVTASAANVAFAHLLFFADRSEASTNGSFGYLNGAAGTGVDISARSGSLNNAALFANGGPSGSAIAGGALTSTLHVWRCAGCFAGGATNPTQWGEIARRRAATAFGVLPAVADNGAPTALTRATTAHVDVVDGSVRHLYLTGNGAPRVARRTHSGGTVVAGYMSEPAVSNIALQSQTLGTTWAAITVGDNVLADAFAGADLTVTGDDIDGNNSLGEHGLRQAITLTAATHTFSAWARAGAQTFVALRDNTIANGAAWFDLTACATCTVGQDCAAAVGTVQAGVTQATASRWPIDTTGDGVADVNLCRVSITYTGTAALNDHDLLCAPSDGVTPYTDADATVDCGFWGVRVEAFPMATSYLATTTASVARNADDVRFSGANHYAGSPSTMDVAVLCPPHDTQASSAFASVGVGATDFARLGVDAAADRALADATVSTAQWSIVAASGDVSDGVAHSLRQTMATNNITAYYDGVSIGTDTLATLPTVASSLIYLGTAGSTAAQPACLVSRVRLWSSLADPTVAP
jgi:hypothetical protein